MKTRILMVIILFLIFGVAFVIGNIAAVCAQETASSEFTLEEITVTAEKRAVNLQELPSSIVALEGDILVQQGKITTAQILESIPNVSIEGAFNNTGIQDSTPDVGISIRGVKYKQSSDGQPPATTATYVDGVFQGYGGNLDIERVEVLRGPQGTLYGRSATSGVVNFITKNPTLSDFGGNVSVEVGEANLKNIQAAVNLPIGEKFAIRVTGRFLERDGYYNPDGGYSGVREGRIKALYQPTDALEMILSLTLNEQKSNSGGWAARLLSPGGEINYKDTWADVQEGIWRRGTQANFTLNYDLGGSILTYIGAMRSYKDEDSPPEVAIRPGVQILNNQFYDFGEEFRYHEMRLASDSEGLFSWLIGGSYYYGDYDRSQYSIQAVDYYADGTEVTIPESYNAPIFKQDTSGSYKNYGIFTEETFDVRDDMRLTAGLRYDKTYVVGYSSFDFNANVDEESGASLTPAEWLIQGLTDEPEFNNLTYKFRVEYDLTPDNMLYALTATGFQPGDVRLTNKMDFSTGALVVTFFPLVYEEEKLTSYEVGSKNQFLDNRLQLNVSAFYYDYEGYRHTVNTNTAGGAPVYVQLSTPLRMIGLELDTEWLVTPIDKISFAAGWLNAKITGYPDIEELNPTKQYLMLEKVPGIPPFMATIGYDHVFALGNGSRFVPRADLRYTSGYYLTNLTELNIEADLKPWAYQGSYMIANIGATWTSPNEMFSVTGYVRNLFDKEYLADVSAETNVNSVGATPGDPRAWGLMFNVKF